MRVVRGESVPLDDCLPGRHTPEGGFLWKAEDDKKKSKLGHM